MINHVSLWKSLKSFMKPSSCAPYLRAVTGHVALLLIWNVFDKHNKNLSDIRSLSSEFSISLWQSVTMLLAKEQARGHLEEVCPRTPRNNHFPALFSSLEGSSWESKLKEGIIYSKTLLHLKKQTMHRLCKRILHHLCCEGFHVTIFLFKIKDNDGSCSALVVIWWWQSGVRLRTELRNKGGEGGNRAFSFTDLIHLCSRQKYS